MAGSFTDNFRLPQDWQIGQSQSESTLSLLRAGLYADVWFCCKDQDQSDKMDRIPAHKLILASRSPVFEAMFYGHLAEPSTEIVLPDTEKIPFLLFLRYLYSDNTDLSEDHAVDVMRIAHKYQVTTGLVFCSKFLGEIVRPDNACYLLEQARLVDDKVLIRAASDCIDDNASAVIQTEGFKVISLETLEYILKGNTFFAPEVDIVKAVADWATNYLEKQGMKISSANKRLAMGNAFYYLRLPNLTLEDFIATQLRYDFLTYEEERTTISYIIQKEASDLCNSNEDRKPRKAMYFRSLIEFWEPCEVPLNMPLKSSANLECKEDIELEVIVLLLKRNENFVHAECKIVTSADAELISSKSSLLNTDNSLTLSPTVVLQASKSPYLIDVTLHLIEGSRTLAQNHERHHIHPSKSKTRAINTGFTPGFSFGGPFPISRATQTTEDNCTSRSVTLKILSDFIQNDFIHGIKYANKIYRD